MGKHFFEAPFKKDVYISLRLESEKFITRDERRIVATEPLTLREYYAAFISEVPFKARVEDRVELVVPDDLEQVAGVAKEVRRGRGRVSLRWQYVGDDFEAEEDVEIRGRLSGRGITEVAVRGRAEVRTPYVCKDYDDCMWPATVLVFLYETSHRYKVLEYRGADTVEAVSRLLTDPRKDFAYIMMRNADVDEVEQLLKKAGFDVLRRCREARAKLRAEKISENRIYIGC